MGVRTLRAVASLSLVLAGALVASTDHATAGGSTWKLDRESYEVGDRVTGWAPIAWEHNPDLGTPEDGPYFAWIARVGGEFGSGTEARLPERAVRVAELEVSLDWYDAGGVKFGPHHARLAFTVPELPQGQYQIWHCNEPCTTTLGDLTWGGFRIGPASSPEPVEAPPTPSAVPSTTAPSPPTTSPSTTTTVSEADTVSHDVTPAAIDPSSTSVALVAGAIGIVLVAAAAALLLRRGRRP